MLLHHVAPTGGPKLRPLHHPPLTALLVLAALAVLPLLFPGLLPGVLGKEVLRLPHQKVGLGVEWVAVTLPRQPLPLEQELPQLLLLLLAGLLVLPVLLLLAHVPVKTRTGLETKQRKAAEQPVTKAAVMRSWRALAHRASTLYRYCCWWWCF